MKILLYLTMMIMMILMILTIILNLTSKKSFYDREKSSPFECGFDPKTSARLPFSLQFFLIAIIFLIFDVEISLLIPMILIMKFSNIMKFNLVMIFFLIILLVGLYHEWNQGALNWKN
uniref:NADH-ubiquinone oxidoreductase chain 3 n=1 Tax=Monolepta hieroglyphica TaxID=327932 RepID=A0A8A6C7H8_9CUCU|nr:NADH dehydrogenase subunit 3 [Monolepta quadriguttata]YP_010164565.1 NADH dehydrogenase subunit 3 [Monolepta hieroglyphica]YP_010399076.1 NADH dehydrogenase subunit 3 [Monolepta signata]AST14984.1 NADH dehydrogenase subunit 3 [Monolepta quadriguttata]QRM91328.1 NADH dehydrogenase subunit 3 [Monolepta hieroglyphica]QTH79281.1 NADH dehydrogenase subunit 3 [Monolepta hieroglyphica]QUA05769.1 NADH dehydrogenase subunit 3 [Monolepta hieroglyphica]UFP05639.1 NADH dehydrogenase subunit 3 [Monole